MGIGKRKSLTNLRDAIALCGALCIAVTLRGFPAFGHVDPKQSADLHRVEVILRELQLDEDGDWEIPNGPGDLVLEYTISQPGHDPWTSARTYAQYPALHYRAPDPVQTAIPLYSHTQCHPARAPIGFSFAIWDDDTSWLSSLWNALVGFLRELFVSRLSNALEDLLLRSNPVGQAAAVLGPLVGDLIGRFVDTAEIPAGLADRAGRLGTNLVRQLADRVLGEDFTNAVDAVKERVNSILRDVYDTLFGWFLSERAPRERVVAETGVSWLPAPPVLWTLWGTQLPDDPGDNGRLILEVRETIVERNAALCRQDQPETPGQPFSDWGRGPSDWGAGPAAPSTPMPGTPAVTPEQGGPFPGPPQGATEEPEGDREGVDREIEEEAREDKAPGDVAPCPSCPCDCRDPEGGPPGEKETAVPPLTPAPPVVDEAPPAGTETPPPETSPSPPRETPALPPPPAPEPGAAADESGSKASDSEEAMEGATGRGRGFGIGVFLPGSRGAEGEAGSSGVGIGLSLPFPGRAKDAGPQLTRSPEIAACARRLGAAKGADHSAQDIAPARINRSFVRRDLAAHRESAGATEEMRNCAALLTAFLEGNSAPSDRDWLVGLYAEAYATARSAQ